MQAADARLVIPMRPGLRSINVAMAAAMAAGRGACGRPDGFPSCNKISQMTSPLPDAGDARRPQGPAPAPGSSVCATTSAPHSRRSRTRCPPAHRCADRPAGRFMRTPWQRTDHTGAPGRRRRHGDDAWPRVREGRRALLDRAWRVRAGIPQGNSRRRRRSALLGVRHLADRASAQSARAGRAHEHALRGHHQGLVRRRRRSHAGARPPPHAGRSRHASPSTPR